MPCKQGELHIQYATSGNSFEALLAEGIRQTNLETLHQRIIQATQEGANNDD